MKKKITALLVVLVLLVSMIPVSAVAAEKDPYIHELTARVIGCPPKIGTKAGVVLFEFTGDSARYFKMQDTPGGVGNEGWLSLAPGADAYDNVDTFQAGVDYYYHATIWMKQEYADDFIIDSYGGLQVELKDGNNQTLPLSGRPYVSNWDTPRVEIHIGPIHASENGVMPLSRLDLSLEEPIALTGGGMLPEPVLTSSQMPVTHRTQDSVWYRDDGEAPVPCPENHVVVPLCAYNYEAAVECSSAGYVPVPEDMMIVMVDGVRWRVWETAESGGKITIRICSPDYQAAENRTPVKDAHLVIPFDIRIGQVPAVPVIGLPEDSPYLCTEVKWLNGETNEELGAGVPAEGGVPYKLKIVLRIVGKAADDYVFDDECVVYYNQPGLKVGNQNVLRNRVDKTSSCTVYLDGIYAREGDDTLKILQRPDKRIYRPGEDFDPAGLRIGMDDDFVIGDWYLTENTNLQPGQDHVTACWRGAEVEVPIVVADGSPFTDVAEDRYAYDPAIWAYYSGIASGVSADRFAPDRTCTRGQMVTFLWRYAGCPKPSSSKNPFTDVRPGAYYNDAVLWAVEQGITTGTGPSSFSPEKTCTRGQMVTFLWRFAGQPEPTGEAAPFTDIRPGSYCSDAVLWAVEQGITTGMDATRFGPENSCTRGHAVTFLYRL